MNINPLSQKREVKQSNKRKTCISSRSRKKSVHDPYNSTKRSWKEEGIHT